MARPTSDTVTSMQSADHEHVNPTAPNRKPNGDALCEVCGRWHPSEQSALIAGVINPGGKQDDPTWAGDDCLRDLLTSEEREQIYVATCSTGKGSNYTVHWAKGFDVTQVMSTLRYLAGVQRHQLKELRCIMLPRGAFAVRVNPFNSEVRWCGGRGEKAVEVKA